MEPPRTKTADVRLWSAWALMKFVLHFATWQSHGIFRDELYFLACGRHLDFGYVDHAPMVGWVAGLTLFFPIDTLLALRLVAALSGAAKMFLVGWFTYELGGGRFAQSLAALTFLICPVFLGSDSMLTIVSLEQLVWIACSCILLKILKTSNGAQVTSAGHCDGAANLQSGKGSSYLAGFLRHFAPRNDGSDKTWLWFGTAAGIGLLTKHSVLIFGFATACGLLITKDRIHFGRRWIWLGGICAFMLALPNLIWQIANDWPTLSFLQELNRNVHGGISVLQFMLGQLLYVHPLGFLLTAIGLVYLLFSREGRRYQLFAWIYLISMSVLLILKSKIYYLAPVYPAIFSAGSISIERWTRRSTLRPLRAAVIVIFVTAGSALAPLTVPVLPIEQHRTYVSTFLKWLPNAQELRDLFADRFGWENQAATIAEVYHSLPPEERARCSIYAGNYGEAGAIDYFGPDHGLPSALSGHLTYHLWGPRNASNDVAIVFGTGVTEKRLEEIFEDIEIAARISCEYSAPYERDLPVFLCRSPKQTWQEVWPTLRSNF